MTSYLMPISHIDDFTTYLSDGIGIHTGHLSSVELHKP